MKHPAWIDDWFNPILQDAGFSVKSIPLSASKEWSYDYKGINHTSGRFFKVVGVRWRSLDNKVIEQPLLDQREVGTLGFLMRHGPRSPELLLHAKLEPGNVGAIHLAPTNQATSSNSMRVHGGKSPPYSRWFDSHSQDFISSSLQSEQGTRFFGKNNLNVLAFSNEEVDERPYHRWKPVDEVLALLRFDNLVNTDARSVLVCSPWQKLVNRQPFSIHKSGFGLELSQSFSKTNKTHIKQVMEKLSTARSKCAPPSLVPLDKLSDWEFDPDGKITLSGKEFSIRQIKVTAKIREVPQWDQPIIDSGGEGQVNLVCGRKNGAVHFLLSFSAEPGLDNIVQLGPTEVSEPGQSTKTAELPSTYKVQAECRQSEEGGRFYQDVNHYRVIDVGEAYEPADDQCWLTLGEIRMLLDKPRVLTNEARSALSLLLGWL